MISRVPGEVSEVRLVDLAAAEMAHLHDPVSTMPAPPHSPGAEKAVPSRAGRGLPDGANRGAAAILAKITAMAKAGQR